MDDAPVVLPIELAASQVRPVAYRVFSKKHGLNLKSAALDVLSKFLGHHFGADWRGPQAERSLDDISRKWKDEDRGIFVDGPPLTQVIKQWLNADAALLYSTNAGAEPKFEWRQYFKVVNTTDQRKLIYDASKKNFSIGADPKPFADANALANVFITRYHILLDKLFRHDMFQPSGMSSSTGRTGADASVYTISPIKNLLGRGPGSEFFLFGLLKKLVDGPWAIFDPTSSINLEFSEQTVFAPDHYYTSGSFVLCHGHFMGDYFQVRTLSAPPPEHRVDSQEAYGYLDFYGLNSTNQNSKRVERIDPHLQQIAVGEEEKMASNRIVIAGANLYLDQTVVIDALRRMLLELENNPPIALILSGSFISKPFQPHLSTADGRNAAQVYRDGMNSLADIISQCPQLAANTKFVLIPGPNDPWHAASLDLLPYRPLPQVFTGRVERACSDIVFATNPTRLCYLSQEILLFRSDLGTKLRKFSLDTEGITVNGTKNESDLTQSQSSTAPRASEVESLRELSLNDDEDEARTAERAAVESMISDHTQIRIKEKASMGDTEEARRVMATLLDQCHLSPFAMSESLVMWEYDHTLSLAQWPTALAIIDPTTPAIKQVYEGCNVMNPGSFWHNSRSNWLEYWPSSGDFTFVESL